MVDKIEFKKAIKQYTKYKESLKYDKVSYKYIKNRKSVIQFSDTDSKICIWEMNSYYPEYKGKVWDSLKNKLNSNKKIERNSNLFEERIVVPHQYCSDDYDKKHYNVFFSGGYDSLSLIIRHLEKGEKVEPFFIGFNDDTARVFADTCISILRRTYGGRIGTLKQIFTDIGSNGNEDTCFIQQPICAFYAACIAPEYLNNAIATEVAYCMNDDALSYTEELKSLYSAGLRCRTHEYKEVPLVFPLIKNRHVENCQVVYAFEERHNVIFPVTGNEPANMYYDEFTDKNGNIWIKYFDSGEECHKLNKEIIGKGRSYIIKFDYNLCEKEKA